MKKTKVARHEDRWALYVDGTRRLTVKVITTLEEAAYDWCLGVAMPYGRYGLIAGKTSLGYVAAVYEFLDDRFEIDSPMRLIFLGEKLHKDSGHAIEECMDVVRGKEEEK